MGAEWTDLLLAVLGLGLGAWLAVRRWGNWMPDRAADAIEQMIETNKTIEAQTIERMAREADKREPVPFDGLIGG